jgi:hypothetical protein
VKGGFALVFEEGDMYHMAPAGIFLCLQVRCSKWDLNLENRDRDEMALHGRPSKLYRYCPGACMLM